jgi:acyl carrier protein
MLKKEYFLGENSTFKNSTIKFSKMDVVKILNDVLDEDVDLHTTMYNSATWDSINHMSIIVKIYEEHKIRLSPIQISNATSVESIYILLNNLPESDS